MSAADPLPALARLLTTPPPDGLAERIAWVQQLATAVDDASAGDAGLGDAGAAAALDLRAALGAVVAWGRGPRTEASLVELNGLMAALLRRASSSLHRSLARAWRDIAAAQSESGAATEAARSGALAVTCDRAAAAIEAGDDVPAEVMAALRQA